MHFLTCVPLVVALDDRSRRGQAFDDASSDDGSSALLSRISRKKTQTCCYDNAPGGYYKPSAFELAWNPGKFLPNYRHVLSCDTGSAANAAVEEWIKEVASLNVTNTAIFSRLCAPGRCHEELLEPLTFQLRDPRDTCPSFAPRGWKEQYEKTEKEIARVSKAHLVPDDKGARGHLPGAGSSSSSGRALLFDLGASTYDGHNGEEPISGWGSSGKWLVEQYKKRGIVFDHLYLWEKNSNEHDYRAHGLPDFYQDRMTFYHAAIKFGAPGSQDPFNVFKANCRPDDFCVFKLDFDSALEEKKFTRAIVENEGGVRDLIDEFYVDPPDDDLLSIYKTLLHLREKGVRAHAWV